MHLEEKLNNQSSGIWVYQRKTKKLELEKVYGEKQIQWLYQTWWGKCGGELLSRSPLSKFYGLLQSSRLSRHKIKRFVQDYQIPLEDFLPAPGREIHDPYKNFNEFFVRKFKEGKRHFSENENILSAFAEGRYSGFAQIDLEQIFPVKGRYLTPRMLLQREQWAQCFEGGPLVIARLCPVDYHRFHYPDAGTVLDFWKVNGQLHSVNPLALKSKGDIFATNERQVTILQTKNFGRLAYIEVCALCVGKIVQTHNFTQAFSRGQEKGMFLFGGSTVIVMGEKGKWTLDADILQNTAQNIETFLQLGEHLGFEESKEI